MNNMVRCLYRNIDVEVKPTPTELAEVFCEMTANEQAEFFSHVGLLTSKWDNPLDFQLQCITNSSMLNKSGRWFMEKVGEYVNKE